MTSERAIEIAAQIREVLSRFSKPGFSSVAAKNATTDLGSILVPNEIAAALEELASLQQRSAAAERDAGMYRKLRGMLIREGYLLMTTCNVADDGEAPDLRISIELRDDKSTGVGHGTLREAIDALKEAEV